MGIIGAWLSAEDKKLVERGVGCVWKNNWKIEQEENSLLLLSNLIVAPHFFFSIFFFCTYTHTLILAILTVFNSHISNIFSYTSYLAHEVHFNNLITCWVRLASPQAQSQSAFHRASKPVFSLDFFFVCEIFIFLVPLREILASFLSHSFSSFSIFSHTPDPAKSQWFLKISHSFIFSPTVPALVQPLIIFHMDTGTLPLISSSLILPPYNP